MLLCPPGSESKQGEADNGGKGMEIRSSENADPFKRLKTTGNDNYVGPVFFLFNSLKDNCLFKTDNTS